VLLTFSSGATRAPKEGGRVLAGMIAEIIVIDLILGIERVVGTTAAWDSQLGAQVQWGIDDHVIVYNDVVGSNRGNLRIAGVVHNISSGHKRIIDCSVYHVSQDGTKSISPDLSKMHKTQLGYGAYLPKSHDDNINSKPNDADGFDLADLTTGRCFKLTTLSSISKTLGFKSAVPLYGFHAKWSSDNSMIMVVVRSMTRSKTTIPFRVSKLVRRQHLVVLESSSGRVISKVLSYGGAHKSGLGNQNRNKEMIGGIDVEMINGNHPNWVAMSDEISMNGLYSDRSVLSKHGIRDIIKIRFDRNCSSSKCNIQFENAFPFGGTGHPNFLPDKRFLVTDAYEKELQFFDHKSPLTNLFAPLRLLDTRDVKEKVLLSVQIVSQSLTKITDKKMDLSWRCDMHPAFSRDYQWLIINGRPDGQNRQLMLLKLGSASQFEYLFS
jgi:hypothetical protein